MEEDSIILAQQDPYYGNFLHLKAAFKDTLKDMQVILSSNICNSFVSLKRGCI